MKACTVEGCEKPHRARGLCSTHYNHAFQPGRHAAIATACTACGKTIRRAYKSDRRPVCSVACRSALIAPLSASSSYDHVADAMARASKAGAAVVEPIDRFAVFERDGWKCYLCETVLDPAADPFDPLSATMDHVIPLSRGGEHTMANVRCACLGCNSRKQDRAA